MSQLASFLLALTFLLTALPLAIGEYRRIYKYGADSFTVVLAFIFLYLLVPSIGIYSLFALYGAALTTGNVFFDAVFFDLNILNSITLSLLTILFIFGFYLSGASRRPLQDSRNILATHEMRPREGILFLGISTLTLLCGLFFLSLGSTFFERYSNLILFRNLDDSIERSIFSSYVFSLTQTLTWLSAGAFFLYLTRKKQFGAIIYLFILVFAAFLMGSRRGLIFPILIIFLSSIVYWGKINIRFVMSVVPAMIFWIAIGKELTGSIAYDTNPIASVTQYHGSIGSLLLRALSDIGITQVESLGVLQHFEASPRFGIDHLLSVLRVVPESLIGVDIEWLERIVRITTRTFMSENDADIPPGLIGQSWLDFPVIGAFVWGLFLGFQCRFLNRWACKIAPSRAKAIVIVLISVVIAMPINSGSYDFTFTLDIIFLLLLLFIFFKVSRIKQVCVSID